MLLIHASDITEDFHTPPRNQGQIVTESFALCGEKGLIIVRHHDASDNTTSYRAFVAPDDDTFEPWNGVPDLGAEIDEVEIV